MKRAVCCFCEKSEKIRDLITINLILNKKSEQQSLMCHKKFIAERLHSVIMLHPELEDALSMKCEKD